MSHKVNDGLFEILEKVEGHHGMYDILLCKICHQSCMRCNYSKHKKTTKHMRVVLLPPVVVVA